MTAPRELRILSEIPDPFDGAATPVAAVARRPTFVAPARARVRARRWLALAAALGYAAFGLLLMRAPAGVRSMRHAVVGLLVPLAAGALAMNAALCAGDRGLGKTVGAIARTTSGALLLFVAATLIAAPAGDPEGAPWTHAAGCMAMSALFAAGPLALALAAFRHAFASAPAWRSAALGAACGAFATAVMSLACPDGAAFHVLVGHGAVMLFGGAGGGLLGRRIARA